MEYLEREEQAGGLLPGWGRDRKVQKGISEEVACKSRGRLVAGVFMVGE